MPPLFEQPVAGPHRPLRETPARRPGSVRRTTSIDTCWRGPSLAEPVVVELRGRDLVTERVGSSRPVAAFAVRLRVDWATGVIDDVDGDAPVALGGLRGASLRAGFGRHLVAEVPDGEVERPVWYSALEDLSGAFLVSGFAPLKAGLLAADPTVGTERADRQADICIGWRTDGPVYAVMAEHGDSAVPIGPEAPPLEAADAQSWHELPSLAAGTVRRRRQVDVWPLEGGEGFGVQSHFRDSHAGDDEEMVMHEYLVEAAVDGEERLRGVHVEARVLPWTACPGAVPTAATVEGVALGELGARIRAELRGPSICTHLNSTLRALADVRALGALVV